MIACKVTKREISSVMRKCTRKTGWHRESSGSQITWPITAEYYILPDIQNKLLKNILMGSVREER